MIISRNNSKRTQTLSAKIIRRVIYLLIFIFVLVGILIIAPKILADDFGTESIPARLSESGVIQRPCANAVMRLSGEWTNFMDKGLAAARRGI